MVTTVLPSYPPSTAVRTLTGTFCSKLYTKVPRYFQWDGTHSQSFDQPWKVFV